MSKYHLKKIVAMLIAAATLTVSISACGQGAPASSTAASESPATSSAAGAVAFDVEHSPAEDPYAPMAEKVVMTVGKLEDSNAAYEPGESVDDNYILRYIEENLNIDYQNKWTVLSQDAYDQKVALTLAMGDMPDVMVVDQLQMRQMVNAGLVADLTEVLEKYASDELRTTFASTQDISIESSTYDGKIMGVPGVLPGADGVPLLYVRGDWMDKYGLQAPKTMDDIVNIAKVFKEKEGAGLLACNKIVDLGNSPYGLDALFGLFGAYPEMWVTDENGNLTYGSITPQTKEALGFINSLVKEGVLDKNFVVYDPEQCIEQTTSGKAGIFFAPWWYVNWPLADMTKADANVYWNTYAAPLDDNGKYNTHMTPPTKFYVVVRKDYPHLDAVVKTLNLQLMTGSLRMPIEKPNANAYESWQMAPITLLQCEYDEKEVKARNTIDAYNGKKPASELIAEEQRWLERYTYVEKNGLQKAIQDGMSDGWCFTTGAYTIAQAEDAGTLNRVFAATYSKSESMDSKWATLQKLEDELFLQIIVGDKPLTEFDTFVNQWKSLGGNDITEELKAMIK